MKGQSFRASRGRRGGGAEFSKVIRVENGITNLLLSLIMMKRQSFRASRGRGKTEFKQGLRVENGTTIRLLLLII